ncbi:MAG: hypothetical protein A2381_20035 [Bdellovibrionales bacterium RIFOXYB1_FULL_37_110]|nr:MAG: hypothetical protein A2181_03670 [Bdellovibrionales bacterium RIFOXYA1_FULL_38_20]OFZ51028.1 MAG: hypothetical protein A2417_19820 [Bdellovibrionales bacterium RIFOXYC1_FULL_37_79]OFZ53939.1 MAG: hypothetical protein A2328_04460 [Bdellovibrionales bacterium RIFOXYB2_FULL_36_6]OFZ60240.1 MAG: hypothetical protein A2381_20035 [Bdellovibrionales bacterium RIFOXYB1_FULL_37_110]OFZ63235.1 MAG: hypothetical protein A2577_01350 [Bdellovibrionales bacterium RIFOXYD1_FULL_36_51]
MRFFLPLLVCLLCSCALSEKINFSSSDKSGEKKTILRSAWSKNLDPAYDSGNLPINLSSPLLHAGMLFVGTGKGQMIAYDAQTGKVLWKENDKGAYHATPVVYNDQIIYGTNLGRLYSRHYLTGKIKYAVDLGASIESEVVVHNGIAVVHLRNYQITSFDIETGKIFWAYKRSVPHLTTLQRSSKPLIWNNKIFVGFADGYLVNISLEDGVLQWEKKLSTSTKFVDVDNTPVILNNRLYINSLAGPIYMLEASTGAVLRQGDFSPSRPPFHFNDKYLFGTFDGELILTDFNLEVIKKVNLGVGGITNILLWKDYLVVTTSKGHVNILNPKTFEPVLQKHLGHVNSSVFGDVVASNGMLAVYSSRYRLYVYR